MLTAMLLAAGLVTTSPDPWESAIGHYQQVESYRVSIYSLHADGEEHIRYYFMKPGFVRMEFIHPHEGAVLIYNPITRRVRLWPFGTGYFPEFNFSPENPLIRSSRGQHVDHSDVGALFENVRALQTRGDAVILSEENSGGHTVLHLAVTGSGNFSVEGVHKYELWLDMLTRFPVKIISRDTQDAIIETVLLDALEINVTFPEALFNP